MLQILTLSWNGLDKLTRLKDGLFRNLSKLEGVMPYRWHIRDNGSNDGTKDVVSQWENTSVYAIDHNRANFAQGMNFLAGQALEQNPKTDMFLFLNNDVEFVDDESLVKMFDLLINNRAAAVGARLLYNGTNKLQHAGVIFGPRYGNMPYHYRHKEESDEVATKNRRFQAVTAAVCLMDATSFQAVGGFDEKFSWAFEDIDLCLKVGQLNPVLYCGGTKIYHEESASLKKNPVNKLFLPANVNHFKSKWFGKYQLDHESYLKNPNYNVV